MILLMTGWMFLSMGIVDRHMGIIFLGGSLVVFNLWCIRTQFLVSEEQYKFSMIPHHSMAIHMSRKLLEKQNNIAPFLNDIIETQEKEILFMKKTTL
jgi:hypothetical protein